MSYALKVKYIQDVPFDKGQFIVIGSGVLVYHGLMEENNDLDIIVRDDVIIKDFIKSDIDIEDGYIYHNKDKTIEVSNFCCFINPSRQRMNELFHQCFISPEGYQFLDTLNLLRMYGYLGRPKDFEKIKMILNSHLYLHLKE